jgi:hypothetical protein
LGTTNSASAYDARPRQVGRWKPLSTPTPIPSEPTTGTCSLGKTSAFENRRRNSRVKTKSSAFRQNSFVSVCYTQCRGGAGAAEPREQGALKKQNDGPRRILDLLSRNQPPPDMPSWVVFLARPWAFLGIDKRLGEFKNITNIFLHKST